MLAVGLVAETAVTLSEATGHRFHTPYTDIVIITTNLGSPFF